MACLLPNGTAATDLVCENAGVLDPADRRLRKSLDVILSGVSAKGHAKVKVMEYVDSIDQCE